MWNAATTFLCRLATVAALVVATAVPAKASAISAPHLTVSVGDVFTIGIEIEVTGELGFLDGLQSWQFDLGFGSDVLEFESIEEGSFLSSFGSPTLFVPGFAFGGDLFGVAGAYSGFGPLATGSGIVAEIQFTALAAGESPLAFSNVYLNFFDFGFDISPGLITVVGPGGGGNGNGNGDHPTTVPEPGSLLLVTCGLLVLGARRVRVARRPAGPVERVAPPR